MADAPRKVDAIAEVCAALQRSENDVAAELLRQQYPFDPQPSTPRQYGPVESTRVFIRDGFIDRYSGERLVFPPVLRLISYALPQDFPYHPNWKTKVTHPAYWEVGATVDHLIPVTLGGSDDKSNWVTTSMARNSAKMNWTLEELDWTLHAPGKFSEWDGLLNWFMTYVSIHPESVDGSSVMKWHRAAELGLAEISG